MVNMKIIAFYLPQFPLAESVNEDFNGGRTVVYGSEFLHVLNSNK
jgi:hypothetical protein